MSIQSEITRIGGNVASALSAIADKGVSVPSGANSDDLATLIGQVETGVDTSDATAAAGDILSGKTAYVKGSKVTGSIAAKTGSDLTASGASVNVPAGYYASAASKSVAAAAQATPSITVDSAGLITASAAQAAGYVSAGTKSATKQLAVQAAQTITPGTADQTIASGKYLTGPQIIKGDKNLLADNIRSGVNVFGVDGALNFSFFIPDYMHFTEFFSVTTPAEETNIIEIPYDVSRGCEDYTADVLYSNKPNMVVIWTDDALSTTHHLIHGIYYENYDMTSAAGGFLHLVEYGRLFMTGTIFVAPFDANNRNLRLQMNPLQLQTGLVSPKFAPNVTYHMLLARRKDSYNS